MKITLSADKRRLEIVVPFSATEKAALDEMRAGWSTAMEAVPEYLRNKLNVQQIGKNRVIEAGIAAGFSAVRPKFAGSVNHFFSFGPEPGHLYQGAPA